MKKLLLTIATISLLLTGCQGGNPSVSTSQIIDNTEGAKNHDKIYLYGEDNVPYDKKQVAREYAFMTPYLAAHPTGGAVIVFPGGAYTHLSNSTTLPGDSQNCTNNDGEQRESSDIAEFYNAQGISVFVCNYRTKGLYTNPSTNFSDKFDYHQLLSDGIRAVKYVRTNAKNYYVDPNKIAVLGYSAGGNLAAEVLTQPEWTIDDEYYFNDKVDRASAKVNAAILCYAVLDFSQSCGTRTNFAGGDTSAYTKYDPCKNVSEDTAPCYIWCEKKDGSVPYSNSENFGKALDAVGVKNEVHVFEDATDPYGKKFHGIGCAQLLEQAKVWPEQSTNFLKDLGF